MPGITEPKDLIVRVRAGDTQAWGDLYREYAPAMFRFCRRALPTREDAEDATMEIFMKLLFVFMGVHSMGWGCRNRESKNKASRTA